MSGDVQLELWLHEYEMSALSSVLEKQGTTVEKRMQEMLIGLYAELVPHEEQQEIRSRLDAECAAEQTAEEAARKYTAFCVRENDKISFYQLDRTEDILEVAKFLRRYLRQGQGHGAAALQTSAFARMEPVTAERYERLLALRMESPGKVTGVFDLDFDRQEVSSADAAEGWKTWSMQDVSNAIYHAYRKCCLRPEQYTARFLEKLESKELTSPGHLSARDISFAEEITEIDSLLNFYMETYFDVDKVFGTHICTCENDDTLNVYQGQYPLLHCKSAVRGLGRTSPYQTMALLRTAKDPGRNYSRIKHGGRKRPDPRGTPPRRAGRGRLDGGHFSPPGVSSGVCFHKKPAVARFLRVPGGDIYGFQEEHHAERKNQVRAADLA